MTITEQDRAVLEQTRGLTAVQRDYTVSGIEVRAAADANVVNFSGHASVTGRAYDIYGGPEAGGWSETITPGAFKRTLGRNPDVVLLMNHTGTAFARTTAGNLTLAEDNVGLAVRAQLDTRVSFVNDITLLMKSGVLDEMSFAFRVTAQRWLTTDGEEVPWWDMNGVNRQIDAVDINKGDVSIVNYGANPFTDAALRGLDDDTLFDVVRGKPELIARAAALLIPVSPEPAIEAPPVMHPDVAERLYQAAKARRGL
jgi:HK97 family phage prohead protease